MPTPQERLDARAAVLVGRRINMLKNTLIEEASKMFPDLYDWNTVGTDTRTWPGPLRLIVDEWGGAGQDPDAESYPVALTNDAKADILARFDAWVDGQDIG